MVPYVNSELHYCCLKLCLDHAKLHLQLVFVLWLFMFLSGGSFRNGATFGSLDAALVY